MSTDVEVTVGVTGLQKIRSSLKSLSSELSSFGREMTTKVTAPIAGIGAALAATSENIKRSLDSVRINTGATGDALKALQETTLGLAAQVPQDFQTVADVVSSLNTITGATGDTLKGLGKDILDVSRVLGEDATGSATSFARALKQFQVDASQGQDQLARLFKVTQETGISFTTLTSNLNEYGSVLSNAGFTMTESAILFGELSKAGLSVSRVMPGLNMAMRNWAAENKNIQAELANSVQRIRDAKTSTEALAIATDTFGAEGAQRLVKAIRSGAFELGNLSEAANAAVPSIGETTQGTKTFSEQMSELSHQLAIAVEPLGTALVQAFEDLKPAITAVIEKIAGAVQWFAELSPGVQETILAVTGLVAAVGPLALLFSGVTSAIGAMLSPVGLVVTAIGGLVAAGIALYENWDKVRRFAALTWEKINKTILQAIDWILGGFEKLTFFIPSVSKEFSHMREIIQAEIELSKSKIEELKRPMEEVQNEAGKTAASADTMAGSLANAGQTASAVAKTDLQLFNEQMFQLNDLFNRGIISVEQYEAGIKNLRDEFGSFGKDVARATVETKKFNDTLKETKRVQEDLARSVSRGTSASSSAGGGRSSGGGTFFPVIQSPLAEAKRRLVDTGLVTPSQFERLVNPPTPAGESFSDYFARINRTVRLIEAQNRDLLRQAERQRQRNAFASTFGRDAAIRRFGGSFGTGGDAVFDQPTFIQVGEQGPERVRVTPLNRDRTPPPVNVYFQGPNIVDEVSRRAFIREIIEQMKREGLRYG